MSKSLIDSYKLALGWVKKNSIYGGINISSRDKRPYPEVTGYFIPTLLQAGEFDLAFQYAKYLIDIQNRNGSFLGHDKKEYVFDSAQALRGLLAASERWPEFNQRALLTAEYIAKSFNSNGSLPIPNKEIPEYVHMYCLSPMIQASKQFKKPLYKKLVIKSLNYYKKQPEILDFSCLSHFYAYIIDGFLEMNEKQFVRKAVENIFLLQKPDGSIPAFKKSLWTCSAGTAQFAIIGYKMGYLKQADKAIEWLSTAQTKSGGFYGCYGFGCSYFKKQEISWANKYFLDAIYIKNSFFFQDYAQKQNDDLNKTDPRLKLILNSIGKKDNKILDAGCGSGRFAIKIKQRHPKAMVYGVDISQQSINRCPKKIISRTANLIDLPFKDCFFDFIYCVESLEHCFEPNKAIKELVRVLKKDGKLLIIDKNKKEIGKLEITDLEQWFDVKKLSQDLKNYFKTVENGYLAKTKLWDERLFVYWLGSVKSNIKAREWAKIINKESPFRITENIINKKWPHWAKLLLENIKVDSRVLELGAGSGELSAILAQNGRNTSLLDYSRANILFAKNIFRILKLKGKFFEADVLEKFPFESNSFDWVFSSGLLEHFNDREIDHILKESARIAKKGVISLVPNSHSIFYRIGKFRMEQDGSWPYGQEYPKFTMQNYFKKVGLKEIKEISTDPYHALQFLSPKEKENIKLLYDRLTKEELKQLNQGYLLMTVGKK